MEKERKQDLSGPDEEALEQHVREMLDVTADEPTETVKAAKSTKISITHHDDETPSAPAVPEKKTAKKAVSIAITHDEVPAEQKPELTQTIEEANKALADQAATAPLVPEEKKPPAKAKKVAITHFDEQKPEESVAITEPAEEEQVEPESVEPEAVAEEPAPEATPETEEIPKESPLEADIDSAATEKAVNDIIASEGDELLAAKDEKTKEIKPAKVKKKRKSLFKKSGFWWTFAFLLMAGILAVIIVPTTRYAVLNAAGVRSKASLLVLDQSTQQPLKNVNVTLSGAKAQTDAEGVARFEKLPLGPSHLTVEKRAFASFQRSETIGWGSNPLADVSLKPTGSQYTFIVTDALSGGPIASAEASYSDSNANADDKGVITLTLDKQSDGNIKVRIKAVGYRDEVIDLSLSAKQNITIKLVPARSVAFVSKRSGTFDIYKIDADGKNEQLVLKGTGSEQTNVTLAQHPTEDVAVLIASRSGKRDTDNNLLSDVILVNLKDGTTKQISQSTSVRAVDWVGNRFVYVQTKQGAKADDPNRDVLTSYDYISGDIKQLATTNYFNDVVSANGKLYYAPASAYQNGVNLGLFVVHADGSGKQPIFSKEVWSINRTSYDHLLLAVQQDWYDYTLGGGQPAKLNGQPSNTTPRQYVDSPDGKKSVWVETRDGKPSIISYDVATRAEKVVFAQAGIKTPLRWLGSQTVVYRLATSSETADYGISINGGEPKKLVNVIDTKGIERYAY